MSVCTLCGATEREVFVKIDHGLWQALTGAELTRARYIYPIAQCVCGHMMIDHEYTQDDFDRIYMSGPQGAVFWSEDYIGSHAPYRDMVDVVKAHVDFQQGRVVDFGCGPGELLNVLKQNYHIPSERLWGMDFNNRIQDNEINYFETDLNNLSLSLQKFSERSIEVGFASHVFEHLIDPAQFLKDLKPYMQAQGLFYIEVPDFGAQDIKIAGRASLVNAQHIQYFTAQSLRKLAQQSGWQVVTIEQTLTGYIPRLQMLIRVGEIVDEDIALSDQAKLGVQCNLAGMQQYRQRLLERLLDDVARGIQPALWGVGAEVDRALQEHAQLANLIEEKKVSLYDLEWHGHQLLGCDIAHPDELVKHQGPIYITPMLGDVVYKMKRAGKAYGIEPVCL